MVVRLKSMAGFVTVTLALAIEAPVGSLTVPVNWPFCTCANALKVKTSTANTTRQNCNLFIYLPPQKLWRVIFVIRTNARKFCCEPEARKILRHEQVFCQSIFLILLMYRLKGFRKQSSLAPETATHSTFELQSHLLSQTAASNVSTTYERDGCHTYEELKIKIC